VHGIKRGLMLTAEECAAPEACVPEVQRYGSRTHRAAAGESWRVVSLSRWRMLMAVGRGLDFRLRRGRGLLGAPNGVGCNGVWRVRDWYLGQGYGVGRGSSFWSSFPRVWPPHFCGSQRSVQECWRMPGSSRSGDIPSVRVLDS
jgi:hypothetical protein